MTAAKNISIDKEKYQVFLLTSPASLPGTIGAHPWFVLNKKGEVSRWEVLFRQKEDENGLNHLCKNYFPPFRGVPVVLYMPILFWRGKLRGVVEGEVAERMIAFIENSPKTYQYLHHYRLLGPNSNTYVQWVLDHFPECNLKLPWNAIGKGYLYGKK